MYLSPDESTLFVSTMRCGTFTTYHMLKKAGWKRMWNDNIHERPTERLAKRQVCVVRNPFRRAVSLWHLNYIIERSVNLEFPDFVDQLPVLHENISRWHEKIGGGVDEILRLEKFPTCLKRLGLDPEMAPVLRSSPMVIPWQEMFTKEIEAKVLDWAAADFESFGYPTRVADST